MIADEPTHAGSVEARQYAAFSEGLAAGSRDSAYLFGDLYDLTCAAEGYRIHLSG